VPCVRDDKEVHTTCVDSFLRPSRVKEGGGVWTRCVCESGHWMLCVYSSSFSYRGARGCIRRLPTVLSSLTLQLGSCKLTDGGLLPLAAMPALREVTLVKADAADVAARVKVTDAGLSALRRAVRGVWPVFLKPGEPAPPPPLVVSRVCSSCL